MHRSIASNIDTSTDCPSPVLRAESQASIPPIAAKLPATHSPKRPPAYTGMRPGRPRYPVDPVAACSVNSVYGRLAHGPCVPHPVIETQHSAGLSRWSRSYPSPSAANCPGARLSTTRSTLAAIARSVSEPDRLESSSAMLRFDALRY